MSEIVEVLSGIKEIAVAGAAVATAIIAYKGVQSWKKELAGRSKFETAQKLLRAVYELQERIAEFRHPTQTGDEFPEGHFKKVREAQDHQKPEIEAEGLSYFFSNRWHRVYPAYLGVRELIPESKAVFGPDIEDSMLPFDDIIRRVLAASHAYVSHIKNRERELDDAHLDRYKNIIFAPFNNDTFKDEIENIVSRIEQTVQPHLQP